VNQRYEKSRQYVGIDLHRRRSVIVRMDGEGEVVDCVRVENSVPALLEQVAKAGPGAAVAVEATYGWYWAVDALAEAGFEVTLAHPRGIKSMQNRRAKTDALDAKELADLLRLDRLPAAWVAPVEVRELRELVRYRHKLVGDRAAVKASIHAVLGKCGVIPEVADIFGPVGARILDALVLPEPYAARVASQRRILEVLTVEITALEAETARRCKDNPQYRALLTIGGVGPVMAAIFLAEIGEVSRFASADQLACWAGLTTRVDSSDKHTRYGHVSKQGSRLLRWAAVEGCQRAREPYLVNKRREIIARRGKAAQHIATVAAARCLIKVVYYTMRDGHARCLDAPHLSAAS
jgi:transposase